jgi:hypothetical protein
MKLGDLQRSFSTHVRRISITDWKHHKVSVPEFVYLKLIELWFLVQLLEFNIAFLSDCDLLFSFQKGVSCPGDV